MKKTILMAIGFAMANLGHSLTLEVAPLQLKAGVEVMGLQAQVNGQKAIFFAGQTADKLAEAAGITIDTSVDVIVATGDEVDQLVGNAVVDTAIVGRTVIITSADFALSATNLALNAVDAGLKIVVAPVNMLSKGAVLAIKGLRAAADGALALVTDAGIQVVDTGAKLLDNVVALPFDILHVFGL